MASPMWVIIDGVLQISGVSTTGSVTFKTSAGATLASISSPSANNILFLNAAGNGSPSLQIGGTTNSFAALDSNGANLEVKKADASGFCPIVVTGMATRTAAGGAAGFFGLNPADGQFLLENSAATSGVTLDVTVDGVLRVSNRSQTLGQITAGSTITGANFNGSGTGSTFQVPSRFGIAGNGSSDGAVVITNFAGSSGFQIDGSTDGTAKFLTRASADTAIVSANQFKTTTALVTTTNAGTPAFGTNFIGGAGGPTTAAQNAWVKMLDSTGATFWVPVWK